MGRRFISDNIVGVHTLSLLASSRVAHDHATDDYTQHNTQTNTLRTLTYGGFESGSNLDSGSDTKEGARILLRM